MHLALRDGEPAAGPWRVEPLSRLIELLLEVAGPPVGRAAIVAVNGRSGGGKTTMADRLRAAVPGTHIVYTDDIAWNHSRFGWDDLMIQGVLEPLHRGESVRYQPPAWAPHGRDGHVEVPATASLVVLEGVGASRRELSDLIDASVWVQSDWVEAEWRGILRDGGTAQHVLRWHAWQEEELPFMVDDRPWERADFVTCGTPTLDYDPQHDIMLAPPRHR